MPAPADTISLIDLGASPPKLIAEAPVPTSVTGPPTSVAVTPNGQLALVTRAMRIDPSDARTLVPDDTVSVVDLDLPARGIVGRVAREVTSKVKGEAGDAKPVPKVIATLHAGRGASGVAINAAGTLALVANRSEGTLSVFGIDAKAKSVSNVGKVVLCDTGTCGPSHVAFLPDGKSALVTRDNDHRISFLDVDGAKVTYGRHDVSAGLRPYAIDVSAKGQIAVVANVGHGLGDADTVSVIDLKARPPRVVETVSVGPTPEGLKLSPDGKWLAVSVMNGSNKPKSSPFFTDNGLLQIWSVSGSKLTKVTETNTGHWCQGVAWSRSGKAVAVQCMVEGEIQVFQFGGTTAKGLKSVARVKTSGGPAAIATSAK
jgi:DNA-binding beta-propeller fold protein YncE